MGRRAVKTCYKCKTEKPFTEFSKNSSKKDGLSSGCKACVSEESKRWRENNKERKAAMDAEWQRANRDKCNLNNQKYRKNNPAKNAASTATYRGKRKNQTPEMSRLEKAMVEGLYIAAQILSNSCGEPFHVDHIYPISKGGLHCWDNLQILSAEENLQKGAKYAVDTNG